MDGVLWCHTLVALSVNGKVDHHDRVLFDDTNEQDDANDADHAQVIAAQHQRQQRTHAGRWQGGEDGERVHIAFIQHTQHDVHAHQGCQDQQELAVLGALVGACRA